MRTILTPRPQALQVKAPVFRTERSHPLCAPKGNTERWWLLLFMTPRAGARHTTVLVRNEVLSLQPASQGWDQPPSQHRNTPGETGNTETPERWLAARAQASQLRGPFAHPVITALFVLGLLFSFLQRLPMLPGLVSNS